MSFILDKDPNVIAVIDDSDRVYTYGNLHDTMLSLGKFTTVRGLCFILCSNSIGALAGYVAMTELGIPSLLLDANKDSDLISGLINVYKPKYIWLPSEKAHVYGGNILYEKWGYALLDTSYDCYDIHPQLCLLLSTSGSTGSPKLVRLTARNLMANADSIALCLGIDSNERPITSLPMHYSYGLSVINSHLLKGATILLTDKSVIQREFWDFAKKYGATSISGVPYTYEMLRRLRIFQMDLPKLMTMTQAGGKLRAQLVLEFIENARACGKRFIVMYGQTEATARMSYTPTEYALEKYKSIGVAIPGGVFSIVDNAKEGELVYSGPNVSMGYAECIADLKLGDENHGVLHTGDVAKVDEDGFYYITGRLKRFVKIWGNRCNLDSIEGLVKNITPDCACLGVDDLITLFVTDDSLVTQVLDLLAEKTGFNRRAFRVKVIDEIPKNSVGKVQYSDLKKLLDNDLR